MILNELKNKSKVLLVIILAVGVMNVLNSQENRIKYNGQKDEIDNAVFMNMMGFDYHKFEMKSDKPAYINVYINEYLNDKLIEEFDHITENRNEIPKELFDIAFTKLNSDIFTLKLYTLSKSDAIEQIQFRIGELALFRELKVNKDKFSYSWKRAEFNGEIGPEVEIGKQIPLLYFATAITENIDGRTVEAFCSIPNVLSNKDQIENRKKIEHYF